MREDGHESSPRSVCSLSLNALHLSRSAAKRREYCEMMLMKHKVFESKAHHRRFKYALPEDGGGVVDWLQKYEDFAKTDEAPQFIKDDFRQMNFVDDGEEVAAARHRTAQSVRNHSHASPPGTPPPTPARHRPSARTHVRASPRQSHTPLGPARPYPRNTPDEVILDGGGWGRDDADDHFLACHSRWHCFSCLHCACGRS